MNWQLIKSISTPFVALILLAIVAEVFVSWFVEYGSKSPEFVGCYAYDAMVLGFQCQGFVASNIIALWLNWPLWLIYGPIFALFSPLTLVVALLAWLPVVAFIVSLIKLRRAKNA